MRTLTYARAAGRDATAARTPCASSAWRKGDRVALFLPMGPELAAAFFAVAKIGAVVLPLFSGYGADAVAARLQDAEATRAHHRRRILAARAARRDESRSPTTRSQRLALGPARGGGVAARHDAAVASPRDRLWSALVGPQSDTADTERTGAEDPLMLIYTSGTTGRPKGAVHTHCGFPIKAAQDMVHAFDVHAGRHHVLGERHRLDDGPVGALRHDAARRHRRALRRRARLPRPRSAVGAGRAPPRQHPRRVAHARSARSCSTATARCARHDLSSLRILGSTGEPWNPEPWRWLFEVAGGGRAADHQLLRRHRGLGRAGGRQRADAAQAGGVRRSAAGHRRRRGRRSGPAGAQPASASWSCARPGSA